MFLFLVSSLPLLLLLCSLPMKPLPPWADESRLLSFVFLREIARFCVQWLKAHRMLTAHLFKIQSSMSVRKDSALDVVESMGEMTILDLPELALECVLAKLSPAGLANMACVCSSLRDRCRSDHLWGRHMREKWGGVIGPAAKREWEWYLSSRKEFLRGFVGSAKQEGWMGSLSFIWPLAWLKTKVDGVAENGCPFQVNSIMSWYRALESGRFWFPAQVYNRQNGHVGFMLSCYDAEVSYDCRTDTFHARYPPHGRRAMNIEEGVQWERLRAPPIDTPAHDLHVSDCLSDLRPGDHIEIQWRKNKEFPYGWWYGVVGHLELCDGSGHHCRCHNSDTVVLEFNHYTSDSRWRRTVVNRMDHKEEGNESNGFYGGIRKLYRKDEISTWRQMWPSEVLE